MQQNGIVTKTYDNLAHVVIRQKSACGDNCASCGGCKTIQRETVVQNSFNAQKGDMVKIEISTSKIYLAALLVYIVPIVMAIIFLAWNQPLVTVISLVVYYVLLHFCDKILAKYLKGKIVEVYR